MFTWFNQNKFNYNKGQLTPIFIVVLVVLIIMALITVNLGKVAFIKTDSANAVDAGALAGGSVMANTFNAVAEANQELYNQYLSFAILVSILFASALMDLSTAEAQACLNPCGALKAITGFINTTNNIRWAVRGYWLAQYYYYRVIRRMARDNREEAIKIAHKFTFMNSGIGSKLKEGEPPAEISEAGQRRNYREEFTNFLDHTVGTKDTYTYDWEDGQERAHEVISTVSVDEVDTFDLTVTLLPFPGEEVLLSISLDFATAAIAPLTAACNCVHPCRSCCHSHCHAGCLCCGIWVAQCAAAEVIMAPIGNLMLAALLGLAPVIPYRSSSDWDALPFIICWIDDIVHTRLFQVDTWQYHQGGDLGLWDSGYPDQDKDGTKGKDIHSYSVVDFTGYGKVGPPPIHRSDLRHDPSIVATDK